MKNIVNKVKGKKRFFLYAIGSILIVLGLSMCTTKSMHKKKDKIFTGINTFVTNSVVPEMKVMREKLDAFLTEQEKQKIDELRSDAKIITENAINIHIRYNNLEDKSSFALTDSEIQNIKSSQKEIRKIITACWVILDNHENEFEALNREIYPKMKSWHVSLMKSISDNMPFHHGHGKKNHHHSMSFNHEDIIGTGIMMPVYFMLYEPETNFPINIFQDALKAHKDISFH